MYQIGLPLSHFLILSQQQAAHASGEFSRLFHHLVLGTKVVAKAVAHAGLVGVLGETAQHNHSGDQQKQLDVYAHDCLIDHLSHSGLIAAIGSEEAKHVISVPEKLKRGRYLITIDPLDGSSNIDANISIGTIFSIFRLPEPLAQDAIVDDQILMRPGYEQIAAGYVLYGPSTMLVFSVGDGVHGFTLDPLVGEFFLTHPNIRIPEKGRIYAINEGNTAHWHTWTAAYVETLKNGKNIHGKPYNARYVGSLVADAHRTLLYGGVFLYPGDQKNPQGKLRLLYEAFPFAFLFEQAGGAASNGLCPILSLTPQELHERTPLILGSKAEIEQVEMFTKASV